jgi:hypothetical protein
MKAAIPAGRLSHPVCIALAETVQFRKFAGVRQAAK